MARRIVPLLILPLFFFGCKESGLHISVRYDDIQGLQEGNRVLFEQNEIGTVSAVSYSAGGPYVVDLTIRKNFSDVATEYSKFFITADREDEGKKAIEMIQTRTGGAPLKDGVTVDGSTKSSALFGQASGGLEEGLQGLQKNFEQFLDGLKRLPESEEYKKLEEELTRLTEEMKRSGKSVQEKMQKEVVPKIREELEKLRERLRSLGREKELEPIETGVEEIREI
jgi:paraquat-inducible protein B